MERKQTDVDDDTRQRWMDLVNDEWVEKMVAAMGAPAGHADSEPNWGSVALVAKDDRSWAHQMDKDPVSGLKPTRAWGDFNCGVAPILKLLDEDMPERHGEWNKTYTGGWREEV